MLMKFPLRFIGSSLLDILLIKFFCQLFCRLRIALICPSMMTSCCTKFPSNSEDLPLPIPNLKGESLLRLNSFLAFVCECSCFYWCCKNYRTNINLVVFDVAALYIDFTVSS